MRRGVLLVALATLGGGLLYLLMEQNNGFILVAVGTQVVQISLWLAVLIVGVVILLWRVPGWLAHRLARAGIPVRRSRQYRARAWYRDRTTRGLTEFFEGDWRRAKASLEKAAVRSDMPHINYLAAANAATALGEWDEAQRLLAEAGLTTADGELARALLEARMHASAGRPQQVLDTLAAVRDRHPRQPLALALLAQAHRALADWDGLAKLLPRLKDAKVYSAVELEALEIASHGGRIRQAAKVGPDDASGERLRRVEELWRSVPKPLRNEPAVVANHVEALQSLGEGARAEAELRRYLGEHWDADLMLRYGRLKGANSAHQLTAAESWVQKWPDRPEVLLTLGRLCIANQLWGKARDYLERALRLEPCVDAYGELAALMERMGEREQSNHYYRLGYRLGLQHCGR